MPKYLAPGYFYSTDNILYGIDQVLFCNLILNKIVLNYNDVFYIYIYIYIYILTLE